jgi:hypothetical protein
MPTDYYKSSAEIIALAFFALAPIFCNGQTPSVESSDTIADSVAQFSGVQGKDGWHYGYWDRSIDADGQYNQASEFAELGQFGKDVLNGLSGHDAFTTGDLWYCEDGRFYTSLWAKGGHANSSVKLRDYAAAEHWAVRRWISNVSGIVTISGHAGKVMPWGANWGGECQGIIVVDGKAVLSTVMDEHGLDYTVAVKVREKSVVDFLIAPNPSIGVVTMTATIQKRPGMTGR